MLFIYIPLDMSAYQFEIVNMFEHKLFDSLQEKQDNLLVVVVNNVVYIYQTEQSGFC